MKNATLSLLFLAIASLIVIGCGSKDAASDPALDKAAPPVASDAKPSPSMMNKKIPTPPSMGGAPGGAAAPAPAMKPGS